MASSASQPWPKPTATPITATISSEAAVVMPATPRPRWAIMVPAPMKATAACADAIERVSTSCTAMPSACANSRPSTLPTWPAPMIFNVTFMMIV